MKVSRETLGRSGVVAFPKKPFGPLNTRALTKGRVNIHTGR